MNPTFATVNQWIALSGLGRTKVYELIATGDLKTFRVGRRVLIDVEAASAWIRSQPTSRAARVENHTPARA